MTCARCNDTGSLSKDIDGYLDCVHCEVAETRAALNMKLAPVWTDHPMSTARWIGYPVGMKTA